jgi:hypothetical protein
MRAVCQGYLTLGFITLRIYITVTSFDCPLQESEIGVKLFLFLIN